MHERLRRPRSKKSPQPCRLQSPAVHAGSQPSPRQFQKLQWPLLGSLLLIVMWQQWLQRPRPRSLSCRNKPEWGSFVHLACRQLVPGAPLVAHRSHTTTLGCSSCTRQPLLLPCPTTLIGRCMKRAPRVSVRSRPDSRFLPTEVWCHRRARRCLRSSRWLQHRAFQGRLLSQRGLAMRRSTAGSRCIQELLIA